ncbi:NAD-dependent epimerase/dehydratase family protein [Streptomyces antimycoticus]|uniref:NAD-dependent epimerase/dehydratase family protein n=1 Tax=Streptomyces antimycoticus TaxID=68175 RepID=UPI0033E20180
MKVLVTGGLGVNGAWAVRRLLAEGHQVTVLDVRPDFDLLPDLEPHFEFVQQDLMDVEGLGRLMASQRIDTVAHLAAVVVAPSDPYRAFEVNALGSVGVLEAARQAEVRRVVYTSSKAVYAPITGEFAHPTYVPVTEDYPRGPTPGLRAYGASKILSEEAGRVYAERFGMDFVALRFGAIYGPGKKARHGPVGVHSRIIENAMLGVPATVGRGGQQGDDMMYAKDVAQAIVRACTSTNLGSWVYNIGTGVRTTLEDFADAVRARYPSADITIGRGFEYLGIGPVHGVMDITRARRDLGYEPEFDLASGVADYAESLARLGIEPQAQTDESSW